jgi:hypothetical protein
MMKAFPREAVFGIRALEIFGRFSCWSPMCMNDFLALHKACPSLVRICLPAVGCVEPFEAFCRALNPVITPMKDLVEIDFNWRAEDDDTDRSASPPHSVEDDAVPPPDDELDESDDHTDESNEAWEAFTKITKDIPSIMPAGWNGYMKGCHRRGTLTCRLRRLNIVTSENQSSLGGESP